MVVVNYFDQVRELVKKVPKGKVTTYGDISKAFGKRDVRKVGWALHANRDVDCPCHRVVNKDGKLASGYAFGGEVEQRRRLFEEGVEFVDELHVDLERCLWKG